MLICSVHVALQLAHHGRSPHFVTDQSLFRDLFLFLSVRCRCTPCHTIVILLIILLRILVLVVILVIALHHPLPLLIVFITIVVTAFLLVNRKHIFLAFLASYHQFSGAGGVGSRTLLLELSALLLVSDLLALVLAIRSDLHVGIN